MPFFSDNFREQVRAASDIVDVIGSYLPLKRAGANFVTLCPFHKEKSPSFNVNPHKQIFHCFGCHKGGDVFSFVKEYENVTFPEAVQRLAERARIPLEFEDNPAAQQTRGLKDQLLKLHEAICQRWQQCLATEAAGQVARDYLVKRGVSADAVKEFRLGAAPEAWDDTVNWAKTKGFDAALCEQAGLILKKEETGHYYDRFRGRLMFPICDEQGRVIAFSGRVLQGDEKTAKYVNSPETPIFTKGKVLYALDKAKSAFREPGCDSVIVCEGQLDTIACHSAGIRNVVAPQGTALTAEHARILKRYKDEVVLCFDGDKAGRAASIRSFDPLLGSGLAVRVASIPPPDDPDSFLKQFGAEALRAVLAKAEGYFDFLLRHLCSENDTTSDRGRIAVVRAMAEAVRKTGNAVLIDTYAQKTSQRLGVAVEAVRVEFRKAKATPVASEHAAAHDAGEESEPTEPPPPNERWLLKLLLLSPELSAWAAAHLQPDWITHATVRRIATLHLPALPGDPEIPTVPALLAQFDGDDHARTLITEAASEKRAIPNPEQQLADLVRRLRDQWLDRQITALTRQIGDPALPAEEHQQLLVRQQELRALKKQPPAPMGEA